MSSKSVEVSAIFVDDYSVCVLSVPRTMMAVHGCETLIQRHLSGCNPTF
jgi:hypothetical protein